MPAGKAEKEQKMSSVDGHEIVDKLIESIEEKNFYHGQKMERLRHDHEEEMKKIREEKRELEYKLSLHETENVQLRGKLKDFTWENLKPEQKKNAFNHFIQCFEESTGEHLTPDQKINIRARMEIGTK
jgi:hypothetical protein